MKFVHDVKLQSCEDLLRALVEDFETSTDDERARNRVAITVGPHAFEGVPATIEVLGDQPWLGLVNGDALTVLPVRAVTTVTLKDARGWVGRATYGGAGEPDEASVPTRLAIERALTTAATATREATGTDLAFTIDWSGHEVDPRARFMMNELVRSFAIVLGALRDDDVGLESLRALSRVTLAVRGDAGVAVQRGDGVLELRLGASAVARDIRNDLRALVERAL